MRKIFVVCEGEYSAKAIVCASLSEEIAKEVIERSKGRSADVPYIEEYELIENIDEIGIEKIYQIAVSPSGKTLAKYYREEICFGPPKKLEAAHDFFVGNATVFATSSESHERAEKVAIDFLNERKERG